MALIDIDKGLKKSYDSESEHRLVILEDLDFTMEARGNRRT
jgi:hypothetical protein